MLYDLGHEFMDQHIVSAFDKDLSELANILMQMGGLVEAQVEMAIEALKRYNPDLADLAVQSDLKIDELEDVVDSLSIRLLALRQPMADDLRQIVSAIKIAGNLERCADHARNTARRATFLNGAPNITARHAVLRLGSMVKTMLHDVLGAYANRSAVQALRIRDSDDEVDALYDGLVRELLTYMIEDPRTISPCTHLLFIAKNFERVGDHATNIAETIYYLITGERASRTKLKS